MTGSAAFNSSQIWVRVSCLLVRTSRGAECGSVTRDVQGVSGININIHMA